MIWVSTQVENVPSKVQYKITWNSPFFTSCRENWRSSGESLLLLKPNSNGKYYSFTCRVYETVPYCIHRALATNRMNEIPVALCSRPEAQQTLHPAQGTGRVKAITPALVIPLQQRKWSLLLIPPVWMVTLMAWGVCTLRTVPVNPFTLIRTDSSSNSYFSQHRSMLSS